MMSSPYTSLVIRLEFFAAQIAMGAFGCVWSTCLPGTNECSGVSMEDARGLRLKVQCGYMPTISSSAGVLGPRFFFFA